MEYENEIVIKDACVLFDLVDLDLLEDFFKLQITAFTTLQVIDEITNEIQYSEVLKHINNSNLKIDDKGSMDDILKIYNTYSGLSLTDSSVLELALRKSAIIYSSDGSLRKISEQKKLTVRGIIWIINELFINNIISKKTAVEKLTKYSLINSRSPKNEINKLIEKLLNT